MGNNRDEIKDTRSNEEIIRELETEVEFIKSTTGKPYICIFQEKEKGRELIDIGNKQFDYWLRDIFDQKYHRIVSPDIVSKTREHFAMKAMQYGKREKLHQRIAMTGKEIYYDLCRPDGKIVKITRDNIIRMNLSEVFFLKNDIQAQQVMPNLNVKAEKLKEYIRDSFHLCESGQEILLAAFLVSCFWADSIHRPIVQIYGEKGASKSVCTERIQALIDPNTVGLYSISPKVEEVALTLQSNYLTCFDNVSAISWQVSDLLCRACTGGVQAKRKLFHDEKQVFLELHAAICFNGTSQNIVRSDLADRTIFLPLKRIRTEDMLSPVEMKKNWEERLPKFFGALVKTVQRVLKDNSPIETTSPFRLIDFYQIAVKTGRQLGYEEDEVQEAFLNNRRIANESVMAAASIMTVLEEYMKQAENGGEIEKTSTEFYRDLKLYAMESCGMDSRSFPKNASYLTRLMEENRSNLEAAGIYFERVRGKNARKIRIYLK